MACQILKTDPEGIERAAQIILQGGIVGFPTETFYGLAADGLNEKALKKIFRIKGREEIKPLPLLVGDRSWLPGLVQKIPPLAERLMEEFWPGPLTLVFEALPHLSAMITASTRRVGLRISSHPAAQSLVLTVGRAITATSANPSGQSGISTAPEVLRTLGESLEAILDGGKTAGGLSSTILDVSGTIPRMVRKGVISQEELTPFFSS